MKINYIKLNNIGPYIGETKIDLRTTPDKNIILIGGKNGAGKTTLLNSIKIALFGCYALGLKTESMTYYNYIKSLFNDRVLDSKSGDFALEIEFEYVENYVKSIYKVERTWLTEDSFKEQSKIYKNNTKLENEDYEIFIDEFRSLFPPSVLDGLLFDGEEVAKYFSDNKMSNYLNELFNNLLNIDLIENLESDLITYLTSLSRKENQSSNSILYFNKKADVEKLQKTLDSRNKQLEDISVRLNDNLLSVKRINETIANFGGLKDSEETQFIQKISELEKSRQVASLEVRNYLENMMPLMLNYDLLVDVKRQLVAEEPKHLLKHIESLKAYLNGKLESETESIIHLLISEANSVSVIQNDSSELKQKVASKLEELEAIEDKYYSNLHLNYQNELNKIQDHKNKLAKNEATKELNYLFTEIDELEAQCKTLHEEVQRLTQVIYESEQELSKELQLLKHLEAKFIDAKKEGNITGIAENLLKSQSQFKDYLVNQKINEIEELATNIFISTNRKDNYISKIVIDRQSYELKVYTPDGTQKSASKMSAGERQLLFAAILMAVVKLTELNALMVFDTPLARLDKEHSYSFVQKIIANAGQQVLVLSTDDEIVGNLYELLNHQVAKTYTLNYDENQNSTFVREGYFVS